MEESTSGWLRRGTPLIDAGVVAVYLLAIGTLSGLQDPAIWAVMLLQLLPVPLRRWAPTATAAVVAVGCLAQLAVTDAPLPSNVAVLLVVYSASSWASPRWRALGVLGLGLVGSVLAGMDWTGSVAFQPDGTTVPIRGSGVEVVSQALVLAIGVLAAWVLGDVVRRRRLVLERMQAQNLALARDQEQRSRLAAQSERAGIAREMHDVVAHSLAVVVVQADGGAYAARVALEGEDTTADRAALTRAAETLELLAGTARASLADTRRLVGVLRDESAAEYAPPLGLAHLEDLVAGVRVSGVPVDLAVRGDTADLPGEVDLAAYRVVQESLTNVLKHAGAGASARVDVLRSPGVLLVRVEDDGTGPGPAGTGAVERADGHGIPGMRERVQALGGTLHVGDRRDGGFEVVATVPVTVGEPPGDPSVRMER